MKFFSLIEKFKTIINNKQCQEYESGKFSKNRLLGKIQYNEFAKGDWVSSIELGCLKSNFPSFMIR